MCGECKEDSTNFRFMKKQNRYNCYCKKCELIYNKEWKKAYTELNGHSYGYAKRGVS